MNKHTNNHANKQKNNRSGVLPTGEKKTYEKKKQNKPCNHANKKQNPIIVKERKNEREKERKKERKKRKKA